MDWRVPLSLPRFKVLVLIYHAIGPVLARCLPDFAQHLILGMQPLSCSSESMNRQRPPCWLNFGHEEARTYHFTALSLLTPPFIHTRVSQTFTTEEHLQRLPDVQILRHPCVSQLEVGECHSQVRSVHLCLYCG
ncbi:hypothetical protein BDW22DRAFT_1042323 [Trametopsis cervina]|nr:hypothetical protein BDW22DRAFT_1042323 [Trametopsis cervina]